MGERDTVEIPAFTGKDLVYGEGKPLALLEGTLSDHGITAIRAVKQTKARLWLCVVETKEGRQYVAKGATFSKALNECMTRLVK